MKIFPFLGTLCIGFALTASAQTSDNPLPDWLLADLNVRQA